MGLNGIHAQACVQNIGLWTKPSAQTGEQWVPPISADSGGEGGLQFMTKRQRREHKLGNAKRAYAIALKGFGGGIGFMQTATAKGLIPRIKKWSKACAA